MKLPEHCNSHPFLIWRRLYLQRSNTLLNWPQLEVETTRHSFNGLPTSEGKPASFPFCFEQMLLVEKKKKKKVMQPYLEKQIKMTSFTKGVMFYC